ncbi:uncharacterized protein LOC119828470 [Zerene cesonia]|uniref:uncharacterized protein LOC119828470 n=1 Tax=Zerene cesonia TaxID=33412 RepID=UPI0018E53706|nr:uncharacterized protein LOC119828470 [Zerene cesonia]
MHQFLYILLAASTSCMAHYRGYESRNLIEREEPHSVDGTLVECPVCESSLSWLPNHEECNIVKGEKRYKKCERGTYINEVCGGRRDCYRGPGEHCTEKMDYDMYGQKCAHGYYCDNNFNVCTGLGFAVDSHVRWILNHPYRYPLRSQNDEDSLNPKPLMLLA